MSNKRRIWRYLSLNAFFASVESASLRFTNLQYFADDFEGIPSISWPGRTQDGVTLELGTMAESLVRNEQTRSQLKLESTRKFGYASCWTLNPPTTITMWTSYAECPSWVAIESTFESLKRGLEVNPLNLKIAPVIYRNPSDQNYDENMELNSLELIGLEKRDTFEFEREIRILFVDENSEIDPNRHKNLEFNPNKILRIVLHPYIPNSSQEEINEFLDARKILIPVKELGMRPTAQSILSKDNESRLRHCERESTNKCRCTS